MNSSDRGSKHICPECSTKYYDLKKAVVLCPRCGAKPSAAAPKVQAPKPPRAASARWRYP